MQTSVEVESVMVDYHGPMELDWDTLLTYDGRRHCEKVGGGHGPGREEVL